MTRIKIIVLAAMVTFTSTGCGKHGGMAFLAGLGVLAAAANVASAAASAEEAERARETIDRLEAERAYAASHAVELRAAPPGLPPGTVIIVPVSPQQ